jgi:acetyl-CoA acetyltransferase
VVKVARSHDGFVAAARAAVTCPEPELVARGIGMAKDASWESIVGTMQGLMADALTRRTEAKRADVDAVPATSGRRTAAGVSRDLIAGEERSA